MKVLLTHGYFIREDGKEQKIMKPYPPLGILYLAAWMEKNNVACDVYDTTFSTAHALENHLIENVPKVIGIYTNLMTKLNVVSIIGFIKGHSLLKKTVVVIGGPDTRHNIPEYLDTQADIVVFGEGEQTMLEIVQSVHQGNKEEFGHIPGLAYKSNGQIMQTAERDRIRPIDDIPIPARGKIDMQPYLDTWKSNHGKSAMTISSQRGCPYTCKWCSTAVYGQSYRRRSPEKVVDEIELLVKEYAPDSLWFVDDVFTVSHKWMQEFRDIMVQRKMKIQYECITRADRMSEDVIDWLRDSGCFRVWIGAESGSQKVIDLMDRRVDVQQVRNMIQLSNQKGIETGTFIMLGYPGETEEDIEETLKHLKESDPSYYTITIAYPIKGTGLFQHIDIDQNDSLDWQKSTDRDRALNTTYSRKYYEYAVRWIREEVLENKVNQKAGIKNKVSANLHRTKAWIFRNGMRWYK